MKRYAAYFVTFSKVMAFLMLLLGINLFANNPSYQNERLRIDLLSEVDTIQVGVPFLVAIRIRLQPKWHLYWKNPGETGMPITMKYHLADGVSSSSLLWPAPKRIEWDALGDGSHISMTYGYEDEHYFLTEVTVNKNSTVTENLELKVEMNWLICKEVCIPGEATLTLKLPQGNQPPKLSTNANDIRLAKKNLPQPYSKNAFVEVRVAEPTSSFMRLQLYFKDEALAQKALNSHVSFFPYQKGIYKLTQPVLSQQKINAKDNIIMYELQVPFVNEVHRRVHGILVIEGFQDERNLPNKAIGWT